MIKTEIFNNVPKALLPPKLKKGEVKVFKLIGMHEDKKDPSKSLIPSMVSIAREDRIADPKTGEYYDIASIRSIGRRDQFGQLKVNFRFIKFTKEGMGRIFLYGGSIVDQEVYEYLSLSNYNKDNQMRDESIHAIFEVDDNSKTAKERRSGRKIQRQAITLAAQMSDNEVRVFCSARGVDDTQELDILRDYVETFAEKKSNAFIRGIETKDDELKSLLNRAQKASLIKFDERKRKWLWPTGDPFCSVPRASGKDKIEGFIDWYHNNPDAIKVANTIEEELKQVEK